MRTSPLRPLASLALLLLLPLPLLAAKKKWTSSVSNAPESRMSSRASLPDWRVEAETWGYRGWGWPDTNKPLPGFKVTNAGSVAAPATWLSFECWELSTAPPYLYNTVPCSTSARPVKALAPGEVVSIQGPKITYTKEPQGFRYMGTADKAGKITERNEGNNWATWEFAE